MNRSTKALARLGTLAIVAGTALSAPFAIGTASAAGTITFTVVSSIGTGDGANTVSQAVRTSASPANDPGGNFVETVSFGGAATGTVNFQVSGSAYIPAPTGGEGWTGSGQSVTVPAGDSVNVYDTAAESAGIAASDSGSNTGTGSVNFNNLTFPGCPQTDYDIAANPPTPANTNCRTQGQVGTQIPITVHYGTGHVGTSDQAGRVLDVTITSPSGDAFIVGAPALTPTSFECTTNSTGDCIINVVDNNPGDTSNASAPAHNGSVIITTAIQAAQAFPYPRIGTVIAGFATAGRREALDITPGSIAPARMDLEQSILIKPDAQIANSPLAEPGDVIQNTYHVTGSCTPAAGKATCTGETLTGIQVPLAIDHGFFTPNCESGAQNDDPTTMPFNVYGNCSFTTPAAAGGQVGNLTNSGQTKTVTTNLNGDFVVSISIGRDTLFDNNGLVVSKVTTGSIGSTWLTTLALTAAERPTGQACGTIAGASVFQPGGTPTQDYAQCPLDVEWTTQEQPLNGLTASYKLIDGLAAPNSDSINTENNFGPTQKISDTGTSNVPDTDRVVYSPQVLDQFKNLVSYQNGTANVKLTKSGVGSVVQCGGSSATDACTGAFKPASETCTANADGSYTETDTAVEGSYLNLPVGTALGSQTRYQAEDRSQNCGGPFNDGYDNGIPGVNDGTQTDVLSWAAPTTTFTQNIAGVWTYTAGTATAATDTLTLNFYNQNGAVSFTLSSSATKVPTSTAVTVTATELDQFNNPVVGRTGTGTTSGTAGGVGIITAVRSGQNEASCVPSQGTANGGAAAILVTNTSGVVGYTFSCNAPGVSTVSMVVTGPGGTQLAEKSQAITFTGAGVTRTVERPTVNITSFHKHHITVHVSTHPALGAARTVNIYRLKNGIKHLVGQTHTGPKGNAALTFSGLREGATWRVSAKVINLGTQYQSEYAVATSHRVK
ncbi:MAG TPA: hypothetical protein VHW74_03495 [Mycobacteriales bacterium]|nr:hypothetical protein [Mycobacteriales bacterium]